MPKKEKRSEGSLACALDELSNADLNELVSFWNPNGRKPDPDEIRVAARGWMTDPAWVEKRVGELGGRMGALVEFLRQRDNFVSGRLELLDAPGLSNCSQRDLEAALNQLRRRGLVTFVADPRFASMGDRMVALPRELGSILDEAARRTEHGLFDTLTLRGFLEARYTSTQSVMPMSARRQREMYRMYSRESAAVSRIEKLDDDLQSLLRKAVLEFGGILPRKLFEQMEAGYGPWQAKAWREVLEGSLIGTVKRIDLGRYGINHNDETLVVFNEVALAWLKRIAVPGDPDRPHEELSLGVDLVTNLARFLAYFFENDVRFTVKGEIFKTTERRIVAHLIPNPGRELAREKVLAWLYRFSRHQGLIDSTGERTVRVTPEGHAWATKPLQEQLPEMVEFMIKEPGFEGELYHQTRMRRIFMRLLKRVEAGVWYDLMYVPFLTRNTYLASLDELEVDEAFADLNESARYTPMEDAQRMAWNLVRWVRQRLFIAGIIDLGYDDTGRPVAMRLTPSGARLLNISEGDTDLATGSGNILVMPDFEVVLFPSGDDAELIYDLDRFTAREKKGHSMHFRISEDSVVRGLRQGMRLQRIFDVLDECSQTPVPQNVRYSIRDWADRAGLMILNDAMVVSSNNVDTLKRFTQDPGVREYVKRRINENEVRLVDRMTPRRMQNLLRDLGYLIELKRAPEA